MSIMSQKIKNLSKESTSAYTGLVVAQIMYYDDVTNKAVLKYNDPNTGDVIELDGVEVEISSLGLSTSGPFPGDQVLLTFINNNPSRPKVIGRMDADYKYYSRLLYEHARAGSNYPSYASVSSNILETFNAPNPVYEAWMKESSVVSAAKNVAMSAFSSAAFEEKSSQFSNYELAEVGLTHPGSQSTVKLYNNGAIDIFANTDLGIRVEPLSSHLAFLSEYEMHSSTHEEHQVQECLYNVSNSMSCSCGNAFGVSASAINESSSSHAISTSGMHIRASGTYQLDSGHTKMTMDSLRFVSGSTYMSLKQAEVNINGDYFNCNTNTFSLSGSAYDAEFITHNVKCDKQTEEFNHYNLEAKTFEANCGGITFDVDKKFNVNVDSTFAIEAKKETHKLSGDFKLESAAAEFKGKGKGRFEYKSLSIESSGSDMLFNSKGKFTVNASGKGQFTTKGLGIESSGAATIKTTSGAMTLDALGAMNVSGSTVTMKTTGGNMTLQASGALAVKSSTTLTLSGSTVKLVGEIEGNFDKIISTYISSNKSSIVSTLESNINQVIKNYISNNKQAIVNTLKEEIKKVVGEGE